MENHQTTVAISPKQQAVLFADLSGWTELCTRVGDEVAKKIADELIAQLTGIVGHHKGRVVKRIGDELMCVFGEPGDAAHAACAMQRGVEERNRHAAERLLLRIGFHFGPVIEAGDDVFGDTVNTAARVAKVTFTERILTTRATADCFPEEVAELVHPWRNVALKGKEAEVELVELAWRERSAKSVSVMTIASGLTPPNKRSRPAGQVTVSCQGIQRVLEAGGRPVKFGRGKVNDIDIQDPTFHVSGSHGQIEFRGGAAEVVDMSRNGIYITFDGSQFFKVKERLVLRTSGRMTLGRVPTDGEAIWLEFRVEYAPG